VFAINCASTLQHECCPLETNAGEAVAGGSPT